MVKREGRIEDIELDNAVTDIVTRNQIIDRLHSHLSDKPLNVAKDDYCYVKIVGNHLEIGRAKIQLEE